MELSLPLARGAEYYRDLHRKLTMKQRHGSSSSSSSVEEELGVERPRGSSLNSLPCDEDDDEEEERREEEGFSGTRPRREREKLCLSPMSSSSLRAGMRKRPSFSPARPRFDKSDDKDESDEKKTSRKRQKIKKSSFDGFQILESYAEVKRYFSRKRKPFSSSYSSSNEDIGGSNGRSNFVAYKAKMKKASLSDDKAKRNEDGMPFKNTRHEEIVRRCSETKKNSLPVENQIGEKKKRTENKMKKEKTKPIFDETDGSEDEKEEEEDQMWRHKTTKEPSNMEKKTKKNKSRDEFLPESLSEATDFGSTDGGDEEEEEVEEVKGQKSQEKEKKSDSNVNPAGKRKEKGKYESSTDDDDVNEEEGREVIMKKKKHGNNIQIIDLSEGSIDSDETDTDESDIDGEEFELPKRYTSTSRRTPSQVNVLSASDTKRNETMKTEKKKLAVEEEEKRNKKVAAEEEEKRNEVREKEKEKLSLEEDEKKRNEVRKKEKKKLSLEEEEEKRNQMRKKEKEKLSLEEEEKKRNEVRKKEKKKLSLEEEEEKRNEVRKKEKEKLSLEEEAKKRNEVRKKVKKKLSLEEEEEEKRNQMRKKEKEKLSQEEEEEEEEEKRNEMRKKENEKLYVEEKEEEKRMEDKKAHAEEVKEEEERKKETKKKEKEKKNKSDLSACKMLLKSMISSDGGNAREGLAPAADENEKEPTLPLKFIFPARPEPVPQPETEEDRLWRECAFYPDSEHGSTLTADEVGEQICTENLDPDELCRLGKHQHESLDEERGMVCSNCDHVITDIKDIFAPFGKVRSSRSEYKEPGGGKRSSATAAAFRTEPRIWKRQKEKEAEEARASAEEAWDLIPGVRSSMFAHQREGFEFVWSHIAEGSGCIVSHAPGTGKSRLAIAVVQAFLRLRPTTARPLVVAPRGVLLTWEEEFRKWRFEGPFHNLNSEALTGREDAAAVAEFARGSGGRRRREVTQMVKLMSWWRGGSVLGVSYQMLEKLAGDSAEAEDREEFRQILLDSPGLVVLDEGHIPRNEGSQIWQVLSRVRTRRRVVLSGTPFQNNLEELYNTMQVVRPGVVLRNSWRSLSRQYCRRGTGTGTIGLSAELETIKRMIAPLIHSHGGAVLDKRLPGIKEAVLFLNPTPLQRLLMHKVRPNSRDSMLLERAQSLISVHPSLALRLRLPAFPGPTHTLHLNAIRSRYVEGVKTRFVIDLVRLCSTTGERVLVFSQYLEPLALVREHLKAEFGWAEEVEVLCIVGKRGAKERQVAINKFNKEAGPAKVMLVSTRAGGEGISLVGASRVVLMETVWNPALERQATRRAYRLGQRRFVYVYHLLAAHTSEETKFRRQLRKSELSRLLFSSSSSSASDHHHRPDALLQDMLARQGLKDIFERITEKRDPDLHL